MSFGRFVKPESIRSEPVNDFRQVLNQQWQNTNWACSFALSSDNAFVNKAKLSEAYCHLSVLQAALSLFIRDKEKFEEEIGVIQKEIKALREKERGQEQYDNQIKFFDQLMLWMEKLLPYMRIAGVIPLEREDLDMGEEGWEND